jgi:hypothetical protein
MCSRLRAILKSEQSIPVVWVFQCQTIEALAARLTDTGSVGIRLPPLRATISAAGGDGIAPLSYQQEQFYQLWERAPDSSAYNSGFTAWIQGPIRLHALQAAARMVLKRQQVHKY